MPHILVSTETDQVVGCSLNLWGGEVRRSCEACPEECQLQQAKVVWTEKSGGGNGKKA